MQSFRLGSGEIVPFSASIDFAHGTRRLPQSEQPAGRAHFVPLSPGSRSLESRWDAAFRAVEQRGLALIGSRG